MLRFQIGPSRSQCLIVPSLLKTLAQIEIQLGALLPHLARGFLPHLFLEIRLPSVEIVEPPRHLARKFNMGHLIFTDGNMARFID